MSKELGLALVQVVISLAGAGFVVQLLLLRQNRRKIAGEATASEANAASTLSGAAMKMVENAQLKEKEAEARVDELEQRRRDDRAEFETRRDRDAQELENRAWTIHRQQLRIAVLENALRQTGVQIPPDPGFAMPADTPSPDIGPTDRPALGMGEEFGP